MENLRVSVIQSSLVWQEHQANLDAFALKIAAMDEPTDLIILPEMFTTGFSLESDVLAENMNGKTMRWLAKMAFDKNCVVTGSFIVSENSHYFNRLIWMRPDGSYEHYDKRHLFRFAGENNHFTAGTKRLIVELKGWRICPLICFDLRFPVWSRNVEIPRAESKILNKSAAYDLLIYVANWPEVRSSAWSSLLLARSHENQCYVAGVNRVGVDGKNINYTGDSVVINPKGKVISSIQPFDNITQTISLNLNELNDFRKAFPVSLDSDVFEIDANS